MFDVSPRPQAHLALLSLRMWVLELFLRPGGFWAPRRFRHQRHVAAAVVVVVVYWKVPPK